jgi:small-conductance mechanosensitive channel
MPVVATAFPFSFPAQTATPTPGVGVGELVDYLPDLVRGGWFLVGFLAVALVGWFVAAPAVSGVVRRRNRNNPTIEEAMTRYVRLLAVVLAFFVGAGVAGYGGFVGDSALVIAAGTLAVGVAGQAVIGSLVSAVVLVLDPEFNVGNYISWADGEGTVRSITLRVTRVHTPGGKLITVPNTKLTSEAVTRPYGQGRHRVIERIGIAYEADVAAATEHLREATESVAGIAEGPSPKAYVDAFDPDSVGVDVHYWVDDPRQRDVFAIRSAHARAAKDRLDEAGITISPASKRELQGRIDVTDAG